MSDIHMTAKWANRMLRPLTSLYHRLGKHCESINEQEEEINRIITAATITESSKPDISGDAEHDSEYGDRDPSWIPRKPESKRVKHKYVARGQRLRFQPRVRSVLQSPETTKTLPGAIEVATPLITGKLANVAAPNNRGSESGSQQDEKSSEKPTHSVLPEGMAEKIVRRPKKYRPSHPDPQWRRSLNATNDIKYFDIVVSLDSLFVKFLEKTRVPNSGSKASPKGTRSLLMTVIRRLPDFIAKEQQIQDELDNTDEIDMADAYFTELESAYGSEGKGWQPLREAVRSQGIFLICDMVQKNWINQLTTCYLICECIKVKEYDAVERILSTLLAKLDPYNYPIAFNPWRPGTPGRDPIRLLQRYWELSGNNSFAFREIELLLLRNILPPQWLVTITLKDCVVAACMSQSKWDDEYAAALNMMKVIMITAADAHRGRKVVKPQKKKRSKITKRRQSRESSNSQAGDPNSDPNRCPVHLQDATSNLVSSLNVALCCMYGVRMGQMDGPDFVSGARIVKAYTELALIIQRSLPLSRSEVEDNEEDRAFLLRKGYILLAHYLLKCQQDLLPLDDTDVETLDIVLSPDCELFFELVEQNAGIVKNLAAMVCQIIRLSERGEHAQCRQARRLCRHLLTFERFGLDNLMLFLGKIAIEVALDFAQYSQDAEDHTFAADIQEAIAALRIRLKSKGSSAPTPEKSSMQSFRWEEGIGEWIAKTPLDRIKTTLPRALSRPVVEIPMVGSPSSVSTSSPSSCVKSESSKTSVASPNPAGIKRRNSSVNSPLRNSKRPRRKYQRRSYEKARQSTWITTRLSDVSVVIQAGEQDDSGSVDDSEIISESEEWSQQNRAEKIPTDVQSIAAGADFQGSVANRQGQRNRVDFDVVINAGVTAPVAPPKRGRGRPRKHPIEQVSSSSQATNHQQREYLSHRRLLIPCSEDEDSDDELSFL
ncbi:conserved hypothetical protein [Talaromyces stipitatus ATCC 10500]|uniref:Uncharacterized protein n=1 Tax=Talaromyces stipitatus (strain ATCC 10500 / CBS 375.48 / QM 6759 / NRRL 1006) TaxID=441959 RepID=B8M5Q7_TALSN|nr:uncharacterized protein TSTA_032100 [Talaromyces stipitatus ATCC 10500]EED19951.1 conserved hypothetical protein [Talaromyces stipitatus ATCC 10500]